MFERGTKDCQAGGLSGNLWWQPLVATFGGVGNLWMRSCEKTSAVGKVDEAASCRARHRQTAEAAVVPSSHDAFRGGRYGGSMESAVHLGPPRTDQSHAGLDAQ